MATDSDTSNNSGGKRQQKKDALKQQLIKTALKLFSQSGVAETTMEDICRECDVSRRTFYNYFDSKQHLVAELCDRFLIVTTIRAVEATLEKRQSTRKRLLTFFEYIGAQSAHYQDLERQLLLEVLAQMPASQDYGKHLLDALLDVFEKLFVQALAQEDIGKRFEPRFLAEITVAAMNNAMCCWAHDPDYPLQKRLCTIPDFVLAAA